MSNITELLDDAGLEIVERAIGTGGSATVHKCRVVRSSERLPVIGTLVAAKEYRPEILRGSNQLARVIQEADVGKSLGHKNIVRTFGLLGETDASSVSSSSSPLVLLLEWIDGQTLEGWYTSLSKPPSWETVRGVAVDLTSALTELHANGIFHRDVKPENVMVRKTGEAVLMDIGVAEFTGSDDSTLHTSVKDFVGSARYASPQFILGTPPFSASDDVYALGASLFLPFTGVQVYAEVERKSVIPIMVVSDPPKIKSLAEGVPASMKVLLQGMLHKDPKRRPTLPEVADCFENPETAAYLTKELGRQAIDVRSYMVLDLIDGGSFFADLGGDTPAVDEVYTVVRSLNRQLMVPSYNRAVAPEVWVADAVLKHTHQNVGHFAIQRRVWKEARDPFMHLGMGSPGRWVDEEGSNLKVSRGDLVLRRKDEKGGS